MGRQTDRNYQSEQQRVKAGENQEPQKPGGDIRHTNVCEGNPGGGERRSTEALEDMTQNFMKVKIIYGSKKLNKTQAG